MSVRAVAARAQIGASTLRHYFPTQQALYDAVLGEMMSAHLNDLRIGDTSVPARERLAECLWQFIGAPADSELARHQWLSTISAMVDPTADPDRRRLWERLVHQARIKLTGWLELLHAEGCLAGDDVERSVRFLLSVVDGVALGTIVVGEERLSNEHADQIIRDAVAAIILPS